MNRANKTSLVVALVLAATLAPAGLTAYQAAAPRVAIIGVTVIDPSSASAPAADQTILIEGKRITAVGPRNGTPVPRGATVVNAAGMFAIPGLWDAHVHFMNAGVTALPVLLAHGVTSVREMGGSIDSTRAWQVRMNAGTLLGPRIVTPGPILESPRYLQGVRERSERLGGRLAPRIVGYRIAVGDAADARRAIDSLVALHVDFVKVRTVATPESFYAILREAHRAGLKVAGHPPGILPSDVAADSGQDDIEHALFLFTPQERESRYKSFARSKTWYTPTLVVSDAASLPADSINRMIFGPDAARLDARRPYASAWQLSWWRMQVDERLADTDTANLANSRRGFLSSFEEVRGLHAAGVRILAGTDAGSTGVYPGPSLHEELALLVRAGLTPQQALWSATVGPSQFANRSDSLGTIAVGKLADIVLLDANPLAGIANTRRIQLVVKDGRVLSRSKLDAMLAEVRAANARP